MAPQQHAQHRRLLSAQKRRKFHRWRPSFFRKAHKLHRIAGAEVCVQISGWGRVYTYKSSKVSRLPLSEEQIENEYPLVKEYGPDDFGEDQPNEGDESKARSGCGDTTWPEA